MNIFLEELSKQYPDDLILLCCDGAAWHKSNKLHIPENIELFYIETVQPNSKPTIPASLPIKKGTQLQRLVHGQNRRQALQYRYFDHGQHNVLRAV